MLSYAFQELFLLKSITQSLYLATLGQCIYYLQLMAEIITINVGAAGINIGDQTLSQYIKQHQLTSPNTQQQKSIFDQIDNHLFFDELPNGSFKYRCIDLDCDPYSTDALLNGPNRSFYNKNKLISYKEDSGGLYSRGFNTFRDKKDQFSDTLRKILENCDKLGGIVLNGSLSGGASGLVSGVSEKLQIDYHRFPKIGNLLYPSDKYCSNIIEPYNYILSAASHLNYLDLVIPFDNQTLYKSCQEHLGIEKPGFQEINRIIAQFQSTMTLSMRHRGSLNTNFNDLLTNIVCYPRIHFCYPSFVGYSGDNRSSLINNNYKLTKTALQPSSRLLDVLGIKNKIAISMFYRGNVNPFEVQQSILKLKEEKHFNCAFEDWSPLGFRLAVNDLPLNQLQYENRMYSSFSSPSCCALTSSMEFYDYFGSQNLKFDKLYAKRAFVHWFVGDIQEGQFTEARQDMAALQKDYESSCCQCFCEEQEQQDEDQCQEAQ